MSLDHWRLCLVFLSKSLLLYCLEISALEAAVILKVRTAYGAFSIQSTLIKERRYD